MIEALSTLIFLNDIIKFFADDNNFLVNRSIKVIFVHFLFSFHFQILPSNIN